MIRQLKYFMLDYKRAMNGKAYRGLYIWLRLSIQGILAYRIERGLYSVFGNKYAIIRILILPFLNIIYGLSNIDIDYRADIGGGLCLFHNSLGCVINGKAIIGSNFSMVGGNAIGQKRNFEKGEYIIGTNVMMGANSVIIGPVTIGNNVTIGASACVVNSFESDVTLIGVPAKVINQERSI